MAKHPYITLRGSVWYFQRAVPEDLQKIIGKRLWRASLRTGDRRIAAREVHKHIAETDRIIDGAKALTPQRRADIATIMATLGFRISDGSHEWDLDTVAQAAAKISEALEEARWMELRQFVSLAAVVGDDDARTLMRNGPRREENDQPRKPLEWPAKVVDNVGRVLRCEPLPEDDEKPVGGGLFDLHTEWVRRAKPAQQTANEALRAVEMFTEVCGALPVEKITKAHVREFRAAMLRMPARLSADMRKKPVPEILKAFEGDESVKRVSTVSARKNLSFVKTLLKLAVEDGLIDDSPGDGVRIDTRGQDVQRLPFDTPDLQRMFKTAPFVPGGMRDGEFWVPLIALASGARMAEIVPLEAGDVRQENGVWFLDLRDDPESGRTLS